MSIEPTPAFGLGSLAQSARNKHPRQARRVLIAVGILTVLVQTGMYFVEANTIRDEIRKVRPDLAADPAGMAEAEETVGRILLLVHGGAVGLGVVFILLGVFVERAPVAITATALVLFIGREVIFALIDPTNLARGWLIKIIFIVRLVKARQAAVAAQQEKASAATAPEFGA